MSNCPVLEDIVFGDLLIDDLYEFKLLKYSNLVIITDSNVSGTKFFQSIFKKISLKTNVYKHIIAAGEASKNYKNKIKIEHEMLKLGMRKSVAIIAIGGGVVLDLSGFIAATYCRGIDWIAIPTSLMAMVDVCVGGKTGINTKYGKNTLGAIYPPLISYIDFNWLY